ncbi:hypothetical protein [Novosphingobium rosa]|nr:hypothetical protein [Novosphingobium rosa]
MILTPLDWNSGHACMAAFTACVHHAGVAGVARRAAAARACQAGRDR